MVLLLVALAAPAARAANRATCSFNGMNRAVWTLREMRRTAWCVAERFGIAVSDLVGVVSCESGWNRHAVSDSGTYVGLAQHHRQYWPARVELYEPRWWSLRRSPWNPRTQLTVTARMARAEGWGAWAGCAA